MTLIDYHIHTGYSPDAAMTMAEVTARAARLGLQEIACTEHVEWFADDKATGYLHPDAYFEEMQKLQAQYGDQLSLLAAMEMGSSHRFPEEAQQLSEAYPWDYILGSLHWYPLSDGQFVRGWLEEGFHDGFEAGYAAYFEALVALAETGTYDCIAHFDLVRRNSWTVAKVVLPLEPYRAAIDAALQAIIRRGKGLEINTSALRRGMATPLPAPEILRRYRELGGEILTIGSDAHRLADIGAGIRAGLRYAASLGFRRIARFRDRRVVSWIELENL